MADEAQNRTKIKERKSWLSELFGGLSGRAAKGISERKSKIDAAVEGTTKKKKK